VHQPLLLLQKPSTAHSLSNMQSMVHVPFMHRLGSQSTSAALFVHVPAPSQTCPTTAVPTHTFAPHAGPSG
jgi:hypothetical protein